MYFFKLQKNWFPFHYLIDNKFRMGYFNSIISVVVKWCANSLQILLGLIKENRKDFMYSQQYLANWTCQLKADLGSVKFDFFIKVAQ